ncbi:hypothetical protein LXL04_007968 [Taraxacum kok-saghyz]
MRPQIVLFGDSITEQSFRYGRIPDSYYLFLVKKADTVVRGYAGYTTRWALFLLHHISPLGSTTPPIATTVFFGANDAALPERTSERQYVPFEEYKENLRKIVHHFKECSPSMLIVLITPPPIDEEGRLEYAKTNENTGTYANGCVEVAKKLGVGSVNLWSKMQETQGWQKMFLRLKNEDPNQEFPTLTQMFERTRKRTDGHVYVDTYDDTATKLVSLYSF